MTEIAPKASGRYDCARLTNQQLREELAGQIALTATSLLRAAEIWSELQRRGVDMSALRSGLAQYLPRIASQELAAEAVVTFAGQYTLLRRLSGMPLADQRRYASGEWIELAERDERGRIVRAERRLAELSGREVVLAIENGRVRSIAEQKSSLALQANQPSRIRRRAGSVVRISAQNGLLHIGLTRLEPLDLTAALKALGFDLVRRDI